MPPERRAVPHCTGAGFTLTAHTGVGRVQRLQAQVVREGGIRPTPCQPKRWPRPLEGRREKPGQAQKRYDSDRHDARAEPAHIPATGVGHAAVGWTRTAPGGSPESGHAGVLRSRHASARAGQRSPGKPETHRCGDGSRRCPSGGPAVRNACDLQSRGGPAGAFATIRETRAQRDRRGGGRSARATRRSLPDPVRALAAAAPSCQQ